MAAEVAEPLVELPAFPDEPVPCSQPEPYVMPTTGFAFTLPPIASELEPEPCVNPGPPPPVRPPAPSLLGMIALPLASTSVPMAKWEGARVLPVTHRAGPWDELLAQANAVTGGDPVEMVNRWVNWHVRYQDDARGDQWATASDTLSRGFGDCEDFALAKMALLEELGVSDDDMFLVLLRDRRKDDHAVLAVRREHGFVVLDNRTDAVLPAERIRDYVPIVSYSGSFAWTYGRAVP